MAVFVEPAKTIASVAAVAAVAVIVNARLFATLTPGVAAAACCART